MVIVVATTEDEVAGVQARLHRSGAGPVRVVAPGDTRRLVLAAVGDEWEAERLAAALRAEGRSAVTRPDGGARLEAWTRHTRPVTFGERLSVCFAWSEHDRGGQATSIELGAGGFGSGQHPSTRLLVEQLLARITGGERVLDVGCGSGVLGLCALGLGASCVIATDVKAEAVEATRRNAALNGMEQQVVATVAPLAEIEGAFDVVVANVGRAAIVQLAPELVPRVSPGGWLAVSGISPSQCSLVAGFLRPLVEVERVTSGEWSALVLTRRERPALRAESDDHGADLLAGVHGAERVVDLGEIDAARDHRRDVEAAGLRERNEHGELTPDVRRAHVRDANLLRVEEELEAGDRDRGVGRRHPDHRDDAPAPRAPIRREERVGPADGLECVIGAAPGRERADLLDRIAVGGVDQVGRSLRGGRVTLLDDRVDGEDPGRAHDARALHHGQPDPAQTDDRHRRTRGNLGGVEHRADPGRQCAPDERDLLGGEVGVHGHERSLGNRHHLGEAAQRRERRHLAAVRAVARGLAEITKVCSHRCG